MSTKNYKQITRGKINANDINNVIPIHASRIYSINNADTIDRIARIIVLQITNILSKMISLMGQDFGKIIL